MMVRVAASVKGHPMSKNQNEANWLSVTITKKKKKKTARSNRRARVLIETH
jgi:hypothetical protein